MCKNLRCKAIELMQEACSYVADIDGDNSIPYKTEYYFIMKCRENNLTAFPWNRKEKLHVGAVIMSPESEDYAWKVIDNNNIEGMLYINNKPSDIMTIDDLLEMYDESYLLIVVVRCE